MSGRRTRSWWFFFPTSSSWQQQDDDEEEEGAVALVPPPSSRHDAPAAAADHHHHNKEEEEEEVMKDSDAHEETRTKTTMIKEAPAPGSIRSPAAAWWRVMPAAATRRGVGLVIGGLVVLAVLLTATTWWTHLDYSSSSSFLFGSTSNGRSRERGSHQRHRGRGSLVPIQFSCGGNNSSSMPPSMAPSPSTYYSNEGGDEEEEEAGRCPDYFRHIHSDLAPWRETGITREAVESGRARAAFRLTVVGGRAFVETYHRVFQTRDTFTQWGIAQLLARYPGRVPNLDLMFNCEDMPEVPASQPSPPPLFRYCKDDATVDIVFPDWSFWGWPELNIRPWAPLLEEMAGETRRLPWPRREPYAHWKGNPDVSAARQDLLRCNGSTTTVRVFRQDWPAAIRAGFRDSNLARQCTYRYKVFVQGRSWSVSEKYLLACDSPLLLVDTPYRDFVSRGLVAGRHYWPVHRGARMCRDIAFAVGWGNAHPDRAQRMAREGSGFARRDLDMDHVYDYMLHLLTEYARLLRYTPTVPPNAVELRPETIACPASGPREFDFMMQSRERFVAAYRPCTLPPPFTARELRNMARRDKKVRDQINKMIETQQQAHKP